MSSKRFRFVGQILSFVCVCPDYCLALKGNQENIHQDVEQLFKQALSQQWQNIDHSFFETVEKGHGRIEKRRYWTMGNVEFLIDSDKWVGLESIGMVESERIVSGETTSEIRYYLNSFPRYAKVFAHAVRSHWGVENCLHWVLDIGFREDDCRIRKDNAPENLALLRHIALNLLSPEKTAKIGIQNKRLQAAWDNDYLAQVLSI